MRMKLRLIESWEDIVYGATNKLYQYENGVRLLHTLKPRSREFFSGVAVKGGSYFEKQLKVPEGTAHFVEHLICRPNKFLKDKEAYDKYCFGDRHHAKIYRNASTSFQMIFFYAESHRNAAERLTDLNFFRMDYPEERLSEFLEKERQIILAEHSEYLKEGRSKGLQFSKFIMKKEYPDYARRIIGTAKSIKEITLEDIKKYMLGIFTADNVILTVQSGSELSEDVLKNLEKTASLMREVKSSLKINHAEMKNRLRFDYFQDPDMQGINVNFIYIIPRVRSKVPSPEEYRFNILLRLVEALIYYIGFEKLREEKSLVYSLGTFSDPLNWHWQEDGYYLNCELSKLEQAVEEMQKVVNKGLIPFLKNGRGEAWLGNEISSYIFRGNQAYESDYPDGIAGRILREGYPYLWDHKVATEIAKKILVKDVISFVEENLYSMKPHVWVVSPLKESVVMPKIKKQMRIKG